MYKHYKCWAKHGKWFTENETVSTRMYNITFRQSSKTMVRQVHYCLDFFIFKNCLSFRYIFRSANICQFTLTDRHVTQGSHKWSVFLHLNFSLGLLGEFTSFNLHHKHLYNKHSLHNILIQITTRKAQVCESRIITQYHNQV